MMHWRLSNRADPIAVSIADRHYNRQKIGSPQFVPPGRCIVLLSDDNKALWVTSWPFAQYAKHAWAGAWVNSLFRNEGSDLSKQLILDAISVTRFIWPSPPELGMITFVNAQKIRSSNPGYCYQMAGFDKVGKTKGGLFALQMLPLKMPPPAPPIGAQLSLDIFTPEEIINV